MMRYCCIYVCKYLNYVCLHVGSDIWLVVTSYNLRSVCAHVCICMCVYACACMYACLFPEDVL